MNDPELSKHRFLRPDVEMDVVEPGFRNALAHHLYESVFKREVERSASEMFDHGDEGWKAATAAREELANAHRAGEQLQDERDDSPKKFDDALARMKANVAKKHNR